MLFWYPLLASIFYFVFCCEAHNKGSTTIKQHEGSLLKFFRLNDENAVSGNAKINITNKNESLHSARKCGLLVKKLCAKKHKSKSNTVKKSFRPHFYDDDDDEDSDAYDEPPDDEEIPEEDETGSYRSYEDSPPSRPRDHERLYDDSSERLRDDESEEYGRQDEDSELHDRDRPGYEGDMEDDRDDWDWDSPRRHHGRHAFTSTGIGKERWRSSPEDEDGYEPNYSSQSRRHSRHTHYHHHHYRPPVHASYRQFGQATPSWLTYPQGYPRGSPFPAPAQYVSNPMSMSWVRSPASYQTWQQPGYHGYNPVTTIPSHYFNTQLAAPSNLNPYQQNIFSHPQGESNSFFIPPYHHVSSPPSYLQATTRNLVGFVTPHSLPGIAANLPRLSHHIYHYPRVFSRPRHHQFTRGPFSRSFPRHQEFPDAVLNSLRDLNLQ